MDCEFIKKKIITDYIDNEGRAAGIYLAKAAGNDFSRKAAQARVCRIVKGEVEIGFFIS